MKQYIYDVLLIGISHLFIIMMLENILLFTYLEKHFASGITYYLEDIFREMNNFSDNPTHELIKDEEQFTKELKNYSKYNIKNNNLVVKLVLITVNVLVLLILLYLIYYGRKSTNNIKLNLNYLVFSCIVSLIIIGIVDGIFLTNLPTKIFNEYDLKKDFINFILD